MERTELPSRARHRTAADHHRRPAMRVKAMRVAITKTLPIDVSSEDTLYANATVAQRHYLGLVLAGPVGCDPFAGDCWNQSAPRGHDDIRHRRRIHQVDVLGNRVSDSSATVELVHFVWSARAVTKRRNCHGLAGESSGRLGAIRDQLRGAATRVDARR